MNENSDQWVIKLSTDQVKGPYSTEALRKMISSGAFTGNEEICQYPQGEWQVLTKQPEFYDALLESLENPVDASNRRAQKMEAETVVKPSPPAAQKNVEIPKFDLKEFVEKEIKAESDEKARKEADSEARKKKQLEKDAAKRAAKMAPVSAGGANGLNINQALQPVGPNGLPINNNSLTAGPSLLDQRNKNLEIQMTDLNKLKQKEIRKVTPAIFLIILLIMAAGYLIMEDDAETTIGWTLVAPAKSGEPVTPEELKELKKSGVRALQSGQLEEILIGQQTLAKAVTASPKDLETLGLLCMSYQQLWPFTKQTEKDLKSIVTVTQLARSVNPISNYSDACQVTFLLAKGQNKEARSLLERTLDNPVDDKFSLGPLLYNIKAEILESDNNFISAEAYYDQAAKLWNSWVTPRFGLARMLYKQNKFSEARKEFENLLDINKESKIALYGMGLVELQTTKDIDKAMAYFANGFKVKQKIHKDFHTLVLLNYAKLLLDKNDTKQALAAAQEGYRINPANQDLKELVITLGGDHRLESANLELVLVGDQFARAGDHITAQAQYKTAFEMDPKNGTAAFKAGKSLWLLNQTRDAINWLDKAIKADPSLLQAYVLKADYESQKYNFTGAMRTLSAAANRFLQNHEVTKAQALLEFRKNNMLAAIQFGERAVRMYDADVELLTLLAKAHIYIYLNAPSSRKEDIDRKNNAIKSAQRYAGRAIDLEPALPESQITYAKLLAAVNGPVRGEIYLKDLIKSYPYTMEYRLALAEFYDENEKFHDSVKIYEEMVGIEPKNKKAAFGLAEAYRVLNRPELAQRYYNIASTIDPSDVEPMFSNAKLLIETAAGREIKAKNEQALAKLELVKKINPDFPKASFFMARCYLELGDYAKALEMIKDEKTRNPNIADSYILAAEIYYRRAQFKECAGEYSAAIKLRPNSAELYVKASICYRNSDVLDIAEDMLEMAKERESGYPEIYRELGYINDKKGQTAIAVLSFEKYLVLSPNAADREAINAEIARLGGLR